MIMEDIAGFLFLLSLAAFVLTIVAIVGALFAPKLVSVANRFSEFLLLMMVITFIACWLAWGAPDFAGVLK